MCLLSISSARSDPVFRFWRANYTKIFNKQRQTASLTRKKLPQGIVTRVHQYGSHWNCHRFTRPPDCLLRFCKAKKYPQGAAVRKG